MRNIENVITINDFNFSQGGASKVAIDTANILAKSGVKSVFISAVANDNLCTLLPEVIQYKFNGREFLQYNNKLKGMLNGLKCSEFACYVEDVLSMFPPENTVVHVHGWTKACSSSFFEVLKKRGYKTYLTLHEYFTVCPNGAYYNYVTNKACEKKACSVNCLFANCDSRNYIFKLYRFVRELVYKKNLDFNTIIPIYISEFEKEKLESLIKAPKGYLIENPVESLELQKRAKDYDFVYIGRTSKEKGIDLFLELAKAFPDRKFLVVGQLNSKKLSNLSITGWVTEDEVNAYLMRSKILVFPSMWPETFGLNVIKALSMGIMCLVSSNTAAERYVNQNNGIVFEQGNLIDLKNKAEILINKNGGMDNTRRPSSQDYISKLMKAYRE